LITAAPELLTLSAVALAKEDMGKEYKEHQSGSKIISIDDFTSTTAAIFTNSTGVK